MDMITNMFMTISATAGHLSPFWLWTWFSVAVVVLLAADLFWFNRKNEEPHFWHTFWICMAYIAAALAFGAFVWIEDGAEKGMDYFTGYLLEKSLSMDNIFVMSMVFAALGVPGKYQHRVLFWGILGALVMRGLLIGVGDALVVRFHWILYLFSAFLIYTGIKMLLMKKEEQGDIRDSKIFKWVSKMFHVTHEIHGEHFFVKKDNKHYITPLFFALVTIELMDVVFALDSIPAIFLVTTDVYVVYTSNIFAILGLRALYFLLAAIIDRFTYMKPAISIILIFIGIKIFLPRVGIEVAEWQSLAVTISLLAGGIILSLLKPAKKDA
ncbi:MAG: TerC/Alx family metal homeostasis membrane protein [Alphaproteobacteria bacterium]|nr:TerC/Alx family metal homeostasis membrane protein [Alphaproteobacteria bacterium]MBR1756055.1 TerC/Alx family metal homeostasis membrane protein [Alphaproteobacteria bacterium]